MKLFVTLMLALSGSAAAGTMRMDEESGLNTTSSNCGGNCPGG